MEALEERPGVDAPTPPLPRPPPQSQTQATAAEKQEKEERVPVEVLVESAPADAAKHGAPPQGDAVAPAGTKPTRDSMVTPKWSERASFILRALEVGERKEISSKAKKNTPSEEQLSLRHQIQRP
mmetsp:Transcript_99944/g.268440  ORF Transcript_99944/g.268440 Transcript_99944/m.268440 type:complete len:125 (+) Transcript_99944:223-597(+)